MTKILLFLLIVGLIPLASAVFEVSPNVSYITTTSNINFENNVSLNSLVISSTSIEMLGNGYDVTLSPVGNISIKSIALNDVDDVSIVLNSSSSTVLLQSKQSLSSEVYQFVLNGVTTEIPSTSEAIISKSITVTSETSVRIYHKIFSLWVEETDALPEKITPLIAMLSVGVLIAIVGLIIGVLLLSARGGGFDYMTLIIASIGLVIIVIVVTIIPSVSYEISTIIPR